MKRQLIRFGCKSCGARLAVPVSMGGRSDRCPKCKEVITAPLESEETAPPRAEKEVVPAPVPNVEAPSSESEAPPPQETQPDLFQGLRRSLLDDFLSAPVKDEAPSGEAPASSLARETREVPEPGMEEPEPARQENAPMALSGPDRLAAEEKIPEPPAPLVPVNEVTESLPASPPPVPDVTTAEEPSEVEQLAAPAWKPPMTEQEETAHQIMGMGHVLEDHSSSKTLPTMRHGVAGLGIGLMHLDDLPGRSRSRRRRWMWATGICIIILVDAVVWGYRQDINRWWHGQPTIVVSEPEPPPAPQHSHSSSAPSPAAEAQPPKKIAESPKPTPPAAVPEKKEEVAVADSPPKPLPAPDKTADDKPEEKPAPKKMALPEEASKKQAESPAPLPPLPESKPTSAAIPPAAPELPPAPAPLPEPKPAPEPAPAPIVAENSTKLEPVPTLPAPPVPPTPSAATAPTDTASSLTTAPAPISLPGVNGAPPTLLIPPPPPVKDSPAIPPPPTLAKTEEPAPLPEPPAPAKTEPPAAPVPAPALILAKQDPMASLLPPPSGVNAVPPSPPPLEKLTEDKLPAPLPQDRPEGGLPPKVTESGITSAARPALDSLEKFLSASNWQERLKYCQKKESIRSEMEKHYRTYPDGPVAVSQITLIERYASAKGAVPYCEFELRGGVLKQPVRVYVDEPTKGPPRVDWGAFVEFKDRLLWEFMEKPGAPAQKFRVVLLRKHYFDKDVPDMENKDSFAIVQPGFDLEGHIFAPHNSAPARQLAQQLGWGTNMPMILELVWRKDGPHRWVEIASVVEYGWKS